MRRIPALVDAGCRVVLPDQHGYNVILFPEATHWVHLDAAEEVNHYLIDFIFDKASQQVIR